MDENSNANDPWWNQSHFQALLAGTTLALGISGAYYRKQQMVSTCKVKDVTCFERKTVIVTGANTGIGLAAAEQFAELGAKVVLACRDATRAEEAVAKIRKRVPGANVSHEVLDVADLSSIRKFADRTEKCHVLVNNAGAMFSLKEVLTNGIEKTFMTNYLGPWYLTRLLLPALANSSLEDQCETKIVVVGSRLEKSSPLGEAFKAEGLKAVKSIFKGPVSATYNAWTAYANSKLGNMLMSFELSRRLEKAKGNREEWRELIYYDPLKSSSAPTTKPAEKKKARLNPFAAPPPSTADPYDTSFASSSTLAFPYITVNAMTPGMVNTELPRHMHSPLAYLFYPVRMLTWKTPTEGGSEIVFAAAQQRVSGKFFGEKKEVPCSMVAKDPFLGEALWRETERVLQKLLLHRSIDE